MPILANTVTSANISLAWIEALRSVLAMRDARGFHLVIRVAEPTLEIPAIRELADNFMKNRGLDGIDTVRNTIFPAELAAITNDPLELFREYRELAPTLRALSMKNRMGLYFERMVALPTANGMVDQLGDIVKKLRLSVYGRRSMSSTYEMTFCDEDSLDAAIYTFAKDHNKPRAFPCMSFCSFHLDDDTLHLTAHYRNEYLAQRGYGNLLGLGQLLDYLATSLELKTGELLIHCGRVEIDGGISDVRELLNSIQAHDKDSLLSVGGVTETP